MNPNTVPGVQRYQPPPGPRQRRPLPPPPARPQPRAQARPRPPARARRGPAVLRGLTAGQVTAIFAAILAAGIAIRLWRLGVSPGWQFDEAIYWRVSENMQHGALAENPVYGQRFQPFLYQPPMYFEIESRWFDLVGASIYHARLFGVLCTAVMQLLLFRLLTRLHGLRVALLAMLPVIFDSWLLYIERVSYIENALMIGVVLGFLLYARALDSPSLWRFFLAGLALGAAASFKQTGAYVIVAVVFCWLIRRRHHRGHLVLLGGALLVVAAYLALMIVKYDPPGNPWFLHQSLVQVRRVLGLQQSGGTLTSPSGALHLLTQQYKYFLPSLIVAVCAIALALRRTWQCYRARSWAPVRANAVLYAWLVTGVVVFGVSSPQVPAVFRADPAARLLLLLDGTRPLGSGHLVADVLARRGGRHRADGVPAHHPRVQRQLAARGPGVRGRPHSGRRDRGHRGDGRRPHQPALVRGRDRDRLRGARDLRHHLADVPAVQFHRGRRRLPLAHERRHRHHVFQRGRGHRNGLEAKDHSMKKLWIGAGLALTAAVTTACAYGAPHGVQAAALSTSISVGLPKGSLGSDGPVVGVNVYAVKNYSAAVTAADGKRILSYVKHTLHASAVDLVWNLYSPGYRSDSVVTNGKTTLTAANIGILTKIAQADGLYVEYRPIVFVQTKGNTWEGLIEPPNTAKWFTSYYQQNLPYLKMAQRYHINEYVIGTEMYKLTKARQWQSFLAESARVFRGPISYAQWQQIYFSPHPELPPTALTAVDMYEPLKKLTASASLSQVEAAYDKFFAEVPASVLRRSAIQETGIEARAGAYLTPPHLGLPGTLDQAIQYNWFTAGCEAVKRFHLRSIFFFKVDLADNPAHPATSLSTFEGRRGAVAISRCASIIKS